MGNWQKYQTFNVIDAVNKKVSGERTTSQWWCGGSA
jgi:hypothetical protein